MALPYISYISWKFGPITIQSFGLMTALAFLIASWVAGREAKRKRLDSERVYGLIVWLIIGGILGARIMYVFGNWSYFFPDELLSVFKVWEGGLSWIGGFLGGVASGFIYLKSNKLNFLKFADACAPAVAIGHMVGRIGCVLGDGGHVGKLTTMPWGFLVDNEIRHVTAWYDIIIELSIFIILLRLRKKNYFNGFLLTMYIFLYSIGRFIIDFFRVDPTYYLLTSTQWTLILLFFVSGFLLFKNLKRKIAIKIQ